jgi:hypothetical protein
MNAGFDGLIIVPGYGHVYIGVGRVVVTVDASGNVTEVSSALVTPTTAVSARCCGSRPGRHRSCSASTGARLGSVDVCSRR